MLGQNDDWEETKSLEIEENRIGRTAGDCSILENFIARRSHVSRSEFNYQRAERAVKLHSKVFTDVVYLLAGLVRYTCQSKCGPFDCLSN